MDKGWWLAKLVENGRETLGHDIPPLQIIMRTFWCKITGLWLGKRLEQFRLAWLEDVISLGVNSSMENAVRRIGNPCLTGEDTTAENPKPLIDIHAIDNIHPDLAFTSRRDCSRQKRIFRLVQKSTHVSHLNRVNRFLYVKCVSVAATQNFLGPGTSLHRPAVVGKPGENNWWA